MVPKPSRLGFFLKITRHEIETPAAWSAGRGEVGLRTPRIQAECSAEVNQNRRLAVRSRHASRPRRREDFKRFHVLLDRKSVV